jgi:AsmA-like C-terminal region
LLSFLHRHRFLFSALTLFLLLIIALVLWVTYQLRRIEPILKARIVTQLSEHFHARVELDQFHISLLQGLAAEGTGLRIWPPDENSTNSPDLTTTPATTPLISLSHFSFHTDSDFKRLAVMVIQNQGQLRIPSIELKGLSIHIPPHSHFAHFSAEPATDIPHTQLTFIIDKIICTQASLVLETDKPHKDPLEFTIDSLTLTNLAPNTPLQFEATLTVPRPSGPIHTTGTFGPWNTADLGEAPITGDYSLSSADLSVFKGIAGTLASTGHYTGTPRTLDVVGEATIPDFRLTHFGNQLPLTTHFTAQVDATNGDTNLSNVAATLAHSHFNVRGKILRIQNAPGSKAPNGHDINLTTVSNSSRIEDFLRLTSNKPTSLLTGTTAFNATFHLPPGPAHVHERMQINGNFHLTDAHFTNQTVQKVIMELSLRGQGNPDEIKTTDPYTIDSAISGDLHITNGLVTLPNLAYTVPGAAIDMKGTYLLDGGTLNFDGSAKLDAPISKLIGGKFGKFLKPADKFLKKEGAGTFVPIHITGNRESPHFAIDFDKLLKP